MESQRSAADEFSTDGYGIENLPYGSVRAVGTSEVPRLVVRIGDQALDLTALWDGIGGLSYEGRLAIWRRANLDALLAAGRSVWSEVRLWIRSALADSSLRLAVSDATTPLGGLEMLMPFTVADYVDFFASENHAFNMGRMLRPGAPPLKENWKQAPIGYHGRAGSIVPSGTDVHRPKGLRAGTESAPRFGPSRRLDIEAELGFVLGGSAPQGEVSLEQAAESHLFGVVLLNDWSARDIQAYEYVPLGPHLAKSFASSVSPWVVPWESLHAARVAAPPRQESLVDYLNDEESENYGLDVTVEVFIDGQLVSSPPYGTMYWTPPQLVAHMTVNNAALRPGDFFGSGTISGARWDERGSLMELTWNGEYPLVGPDGREFGFLRDGQTVTISGSAPGPGRSVICFGQVCGTVVAAT